MIIILMGLSHGSRVGEKDYYILSGKWNSFAWIHVTSLHNEHNTISFCLVCKHTNSPGECVACSRLDRIERSINPGWTHLFSKLVQNCTCFVTFGLCYPDEQRLSAVEKLIKATSIQSIKQWGESVQDCVTCPHSFAAGGKVVCNFRSLSVVVECVRWLWRPPRT